MKDLTTQQEYGIVPSSFKKYYGYVLQISKDKIDEHCEANRIDPNDMIDILIFFVDEKRTIKMSYSEFKRRLL